MNNKLEYIKFGYPKYLISSDGNVINTITGEYVTKRIIRKYYYVDLHRGKERKNYRLGRLVAKYFIPNPKKLPQVNHIDGNRLNDNVNNLEWVTASQNQIHKIALQKKLGKYKTPKGNRKHTDKKILSVHELRKQGMKHKEIAKRLKMGISTVTHVLLGSRRKISN